jgi:lipoprotein-anchoring transpeptidase ErfK/SrfK
VKLLVCNRAEFWLRLYNDERRVREYRCAVGMPEYPTPEGAYEIENRAKDPDWWLPAEDWVSEELRGTVIEAGPDNPIKSRWLGIRGGVGVHGTDAEESIGTAASHGCIRLTVADVEDLFDRVAVGTPVAVI